MHSRAASCLRCPWPQRRGRSHHGGKHFLRNGQCHHPQRRDSGARRYQSGNAEHRSLGDREKNYLENESHHSGAFRRRPCDMDSIMAVAKAHHLFVVEDCAHAIETEYHGKKAGSFGDMGVFSFYATKNLATGEGGMVLSRNEDLIARIKILALHGMSRDAWARFSDSGYKHYHVEEAGYKYNMMDLQAAIGIHQLRKIERFYARRVEIWNSYQKELRGLPIGLPAPLDPATRHALHLFIIRVDKERCGVSRDEFLERMTKRSVGVGVHYQAIPEHPYYQRTFGWKAEEYPAATRFGRECVSLPISPKLTPRDVERVIDAVRSILKP